MTTESINRSPCLPRTPQPWREMIILGGIALAYFIVARLGLLFVAHPENVAALWPVSGFALGVLLLRDRRRWTGTLTAFFIANSLANLAGGNSLVVSLGFALANTLEPALGAWLLRKYYARPITFTHPADVIALLIAAAFSAAVSGVLGAVVPFAAFGAPYLQTWLLWWVSDGLGILLVAPVIVTWTTRPDRSELTPARLLESIILIILLAGGTWLIFGPLTVAEEAAIRPYLLYPLLVWTALRFTPRGVSSILLLAGGMAAWDTALDTGAFAFSGQTITQHILALQFFLGITSVTILILSAVVTEHRRTLKALQNKTDELNGFFSVNLDLLCIADVQGYFRRLNPEWEKTLGYPLDELVGQCFLELVHPDDQVSTRDALSRLAAQQPILGFVNRYRCYDGSWRWIEWRARPTGDLIYAAARDITARKQAEEDINLLKHSIDVHYDGAYWMDTDNRFIYVNEAGCRALGYTRADLLQMTLANVNPRATPQALQRVWEQLRTDGFFSTESVHRRKDGSEFPVQLTSTYVQYGGQEYNCGFAHDITEHKRAEEKLRDNEQRLRRAQEIAHVGDWELNLALQTITASEEAFRIYGIERTSPYLPLDLVQSCVIPEDRSRLDAALLRTVTQGAAYDVEFCIQRIADGELRHIHSRAELIQDQTGRPVRVLGTIQDITASKQTETELRQNEAQYRLLAENMSDTIWLMDLNLHITYASPSVLRQRGYTLDELNTQPLNEQMTPESYRRALALLAEATSSHNLNQPQPRLNYSLELEYYRKDGSKFWSENTFTLICDETGRPLHILGSGRDITDRKRRERQLEAIVDTAMALRAAPTYAEMLPVVVHKVYDLLKADSAALVTRDATAGAALIAYGQGVWADWVGRRIPAGEGVTGYVLATGRHYVSDDAQHDARIYWPDFAAHVSAIACVPLIAQDQPIGALWAGRGTVITRDEVDLLQAIADMAANALQRAQIVETLEQRVAERTRELEAANERLKELDRLKSKFVSDVSHELRTPVTSLRLCLDLLERGQPEKRTQYLQVIRQQTDRQAKLVEDILNLSRLELGAAKVQFQAVDLNELVVQVVQAHRPTAETAGLELICETTSGLPLVRGEPNQLGQVVNNLIANAIHYTPHGQVAVRTDLAAGHVYVIVRDTGLGIAPEDLPHVFERFYRGSRTSNIRGTGLGLAIVKEIVDLHDGRVEVTSEAGAGSTFQVYLPRLNS